MNCSGKHRTTERTAVTNYLNTKEVGNHFNVSPTDVAYWCSIGLVKALPRNVARAPWRIRPEEIERLEQEGLPPSRRTLERR
nr:MAG TPA: helix-turn-helix domain protein [Caudoviricetes sp.]